MRDDVADKFRSLEQRIERTGEMYQQLIKAQGEPIRLNYKSGTRYMHLARQRDKENHTIGVFWRMFVHGADGRRIWKSGWHPLRVPQDVKKRMDERNFERFSEVNEIAKAVYAARRDLMKKKQSVLATLQNVERGNDARMNKAEELIDEFVL